jgi:hypothetical protein
MKGLIIWEWVGKKVYDDGGGGTTQQQVGGRKSSTAAQLEGKG